MQFIQWATEKSESFLMWQRFVFKGIMPLICSLEAIAAGDWNLNLISSKQMIPHFFLMDAINYKHWSIADLRLKMEYGQEIVDNLKEGAFKIALTSNKNSSMPFDMAHEVSFNKPLKSSIKHHKINDSYLEIISKYLPYRAKISGSLDKITKRAKSENNPSHYLIHAPEAKRDMKEANKYMKILEESCGANEAFISNETVPLHSLGGLKANNKVKETILNGLEKAESLMKTTIGDYLVSVDLTTKKIKKTKAELFPSLLDPKKKKKSSSSNQDKKRLMKTLAVVDERGITLKEIGKYQIGDNSALSENKGESPYLGQQKSTITKEYLKVRFPEAFSMTRPTNSDDVIVDSEMELFVAPKSDKLTFKGNIINQFENRFEPEFRKCCHLVLIFDEQECDDEIANILKNATRAKRYEDTEQPAFPVISPDQEVPRDWDSIVKNPDARKDYKTIVGKIYLSEEITNKVPEGKCMYVNGLFGNGITYRIKNHKEIVTVCKDIEMQQVEPDVKIFSFITHHSNMKNILIKSADTDVLFTGLLHQAKQDSQQCTVQMGRYVSRDYCNLKSLVKGVSELYSQATKEYGAVKVTQMFAQLYAITGCDFCPYFKHLSKASIFQANETVNPDTVLSSFTDFLKLMIFVYENSRRFKSYTFSPKLDDRIEDISRLRKDIFFPTTVMIWSKLPFR